MALDKLDACVKSLKQQRIPVSRGMVGEEIHAHRVTNPEAL